jgi:ABC-2 type transport system permease protein
MQAVGQKSTSTLTMLIFSAVSIAVLKATVGFEIKPYAVCLFIPALLLAALFNFFLFFLVSISAFWITEAERFFYALSLVIMVGSGGVFPITVFGDTYAAVSRFLPFQYTSYFPISVMTGALSAPEVLSGMLMQLIWISVFAALVSVMWRIGLKKYVAVVG